MPQPVTLVDEYSGGDGAYVDRCIAQFQNTHSQVSIMCSDSNAVNLGTSIPNSQESFSNIVATDEFISMAAQFNTFRVRAIRFDVYDINPALSAPNFWSTYHIDGGNPPETLANILDRPDSQSIPPGSGKLSFTWRPKGTLENSFQAVGSYVDFGGLAWYVNATASGTVQKYTVVLKAIVDFRGRS